jgi:hypothetical protein
MFEGILEWIASAAKMARKITIHRTSSDPRSFTSPPPRRVRVAIASKVSHVAQL